MLNRRGAAAHHPSLLARYSHTLGELMLRRHTELATEAARTQADMASRAKSAFLATMSHELRTPLSAIIGFSDLIKNMKDDPQEVEACRGYAQHIADAGRHLLDVVSDILDISKIESGTFSLNIEPCDISEIIDSAVAMVKDRIAQKQQGLEVRLPGRLPDMAVDARRVRQIVLNLLSNAHKFTPEQGHILVVAEAARDGGIIISVVDSGCGMDGEQLKIAMLPFGQVQSHFTRSQEGTGLGLPIALGLARQHGGDLHLESEPGVGTTAILTLPPSRPMPAEPDDRKFFMPKSSFKSAPADRGSS